MDSGKYDHLIGEILQQEGNICNFLDVVFSFLYRRTDFFVVQESRDGRIGFQPGCAETIVRKAFFKWKNMSPTEFSNLSKETKKAELKVPTRIDKLPADEGDLDNVSLTKSHTGNETNKKKDVSSSDTYNGADRGSYCWSQSITDLDILVRVPDYITKSRDVNVNVGDNTLLVKVKEQSNPADWKILVDGRFCHKTCKDESLWSLTPGKHVSIHCEKCDERWWYGLLTTEPKLDTASLDASRPMSELNDQEQMKIQELIVNQEKKELGFKTSQQVKAEEVLRGAWNAEGSPFKGTEFDPSILEFKG